MFGGMSTMVWGYIVAKIVGEVREQACYG